ncbi:MAG: VWA domain-containing protein [Planctomycetes bacterium]|nr:VWA domain-containing protein [Planctomycetota bacterium]
MVRITYARFDPKSLSSEQRFERTRKLWLHLALMADGDLEQTERWLDQVDRRMGVFDAQFSKADFLARLAREGMIEKERGGSMKLAPGGEQAIRRDALTRLFSALKPGTRGSEGSHRSKTIGQGHERTSETRPYVFGDDPGSIDYRTSMQNAMRRGGLDVEFSERDVEVFETEATTSCASVILIDVSHSMTLYGEDRITPAKQVALALVELIRTRYPKDDLAVVLFGDEATEVPLHRIPYVSNGPYHTNTRAGLRVAAQLLARKKHPNKQILMITDGKPSALTEADGRLYKNPFGLDDRVVVATLDEAARLRRDGVVVTTFMLTNDPTLVDFIETFTRTNHGRAYYASPERLGNFVLVDYIRNRRGRV